MTRFIGRRGLAGLALSAGLGLSLGCQTWVGGMTLPSGHYLKDSPDYLTPGPQFPLGNELAAMQAASSGAAVPAATTPAAPAPKP